MKYLLITLMFICGHSFAQNKTITSYKNTVGNISGDSIIWEDFLINPMTFTFTDLSISVNDKIGSVYKILNKLSTKKTTIYNCVDEKNRNCKLSVVDDILHSYIMVSYEKVVYLYTLKTP